MLVTKALLALCTPAHSLTNCPAYFSDSYPKQIGMSPSWESSCSTYYLLCSSYLRDHLKHGCKQGYLSRPLWKSNIFWWGFLDYWYGNLFIFVCLFLKIWGNHLSFRVSFNYIISICLLIIFQEIEKFSCVFRIYKMKQAVYFSFSTLKQIIHSSPWLLDSSSFCTYHN